jgi:cytosine/adenosine deaminase-related metal-dependent hydrolase
MENDGSTHAFISIIACYLIVSQDADLIVRDGYLAAEDALVDVAVSDGEIVTVSSSIEEPAERVIDASGGLLSPGLVDTHCHTDMALAATGERFPKYEYDTTDRERLIGKSHEYFAGESPAELRSRIRRAAELAVTNGVLHLRNHVYLDSTVGTKVVEATLDVQEELDDAIDMEIIAFPQQGFLRDPGSQGVAREALDMGADLVGGIDPGSLNNDVERAIDTWFDIATDHDVDIDVHLHDRGTLGTYTLERLADRTVEQGYEGRVTAGHCFALADAASESENHHGTSMEAILDTLSAADLQVVTCYQSTRPGMPIEQFQTNGLTMAHGTDGARHVWGPFGNMDSLEAMLVNSIKLNLDSGQNFKTDEGLGQLWDLITTNGAEILGIEETYPIRPGTPADIVVHNAPSPQWAIIESPAPRYVIKDGQVVAQNEPRETSVTL